MTSVFHLILTIRTEKVLKKSIAFLSQADNTNSKGISVYQRLIKFNRFLCAVALIFNIVIKSIQEALLFRKHALGNAVVFGGDYAQYYWREAILNILKYVINVIFCLKPLCYNAAYIWLKSGNDGK